MAEKKSKSKIKNDRKELLADDGVTRLRLRLNKKREYIAILELELFNTRVALYEYQQIYDEHILPLEHRLRYLRNELYKLLESQHGNGKEEEADLGEEEEPQFSYQEQDENGWRKAAKQAKKAKNPHLEEKIRHLFRELAKRFHPDLTSDLEEKKWRQSIMTKVNMAYAKRDLKALQSLAEQPDRPAPSLAQSTEDEILMMKAELVRLDGVIAELKASIHHLEESPAMKLMMEARMQRRNGKDLLSEMEMILKEKIADLEEHLTVLGVELEDIVVEDTVV